MTILLPPRVEAEIQREKHKAERERRTALAHRLLDFDDPVCREWQPTVAQIDPYLRLGRARPMAYEPEMNVKPGYYHWVRDNPTADMTIEPITGPDGESFAEPDSSLLDELRRNDLQHPAVWHAHIAMKAEAERRQEREAQERHQRRVDGTIDRYKSKVNASVSMAEGWSNSTAGRKGRSK